MLSRKEGFFMSDPDPQIIKKVIQWITFADEDLNLASGALSYGTSGPYRLIAYHTQQCAEKCLKEYLVYHNVDFPYTHNIRRLLKLCGEHATWPQNLKDAEELTPYAITAHYPGEDEEVTHDEAKRAVEIARQVREQVRTAFQQLGVNLPE
jgi:HEPN domain-containing protein